jgi:hypothetical protein
MKKLIAVAFLTLGIVLVRFPISAEAGTKILWPDQFKLSAFDQSMADAETKAMRDFSRLRAIGGCAVYESGVLLPAGKKITRFEVSAFSSYGDMVIADLLYDDVGGYGPELAASLKLEGLNEHAWHMGELRSPKVYASRKYWVLLNVCGSAIVKGVRVSYR